MPGWLGNLFDSNEKEENRLKPVVMQINELEPRFQQLSDEDLKAKTVEFQERLAGGETLDDILPEAFAAVREASRRTIGLRHFDVQLMGGMVLQQGKIAEMKTGEGKTLVATLPLYLNALKGKGCHLVMANEYLVRRNAYWMASVYNALGVTVASIYPVQSPAEQLPALIYDPNYHNEKDQRWPHFRPVTRKEAYAADITYGTNNEFGLDYLRDNMVIDMTQKVQRPLSYAIIDEVDNILIDVARTPLIISGQGEDPTQKYYIFADIVSSLTPEEYEIDEREKQIYLTDAGNKKVVQLLAQEGLLKSTNLYDASNYHVSQFLDNALKARLLFKRDKEYVVRNGEVTIVDESTGRMMPGRRYPEGLHQAIEAKEKVKIQRGAITLATITFQNYFRLYNKLAGMTSTAATEAEELFKIYKLDVVVIPTNRPIIRVDHMDLVYRDENSKFNAIANEIEKLHKEGKPVLMGVTSIEKSDLLSDLLMKRGVQHQVLNAKYYEREAEIIKRAGRVGAVTVATNMAGRGVDIVLGGRPPEREEFEDEKGFQQKYSDWKLEHDKVIGLGGLHVIGTERNKARRIDNQLRECAGRQGDPGNSQFFVSLEDDIVKRFGGDRAKGVMEWTGIDENTPIEHPMISKAIENSQVKMEAYNFDIRTHLVDYDNVVNKQRDVIYGERDKIMMGADLKSSIIDMVGRQIEQIVREYCRSYSEVALSGILEVMAEIFPLPENIKDMQLEKLGQKQLTDKLIDYARQVYDLREKEQGAEQMRLLERLVMLKIIDDHWKEYLLVMDHLWQGIGLETVQSMDSLGVFEKKSGTCFDSMIADTQYDIVHTIYKVNMEKRETPAHLPSPPPGQKVGRNDPCPCGSGKRYKHCHGK